MPYDQEQQTAQRTVVGNFELTLNLTDKRGIRMSGVVYSDDTPAEINARLDLYQAALDRQFIKGDIINKRAQIVAHKQHLQNIRDSYAGLLEKKSNGGKLSSQDKLQLDNFEPTMLKAQRMIDDLEFDIKAAEAKL